MKKTLFLLIAIALGMGVKAQCPLTTAVDFTATDIHGTEIHLFDILDSGQYVLIDFFYYNCSACNATVPMMVQSYQAFGCNMHDVFYMEISDRDSDALCQSWTTNYGVEYPTISGTAGGAAIDNQYGISSYPTIILIAPDHSIVINDLWPINNVQNIITALESHGVTQQSCNPQDVMPNFTGTDLDGNEIHLYDILDGGQAVLINFFLSDDNGALFMPFLIEAYSLFGCNSHDVFFMEICPDKGNTICHNWVETYNVPYPTISRDGGGNAIVQSIPVAFYPAVMIIRPDHTIAYRDLYPLENTQTIVNALEGEGNEQHECNVNAVETHKYSFRLFPNPANDFVTLSGENLGTVSVYNILGQKIDGFEANDTELRINTTSYEDGVYFIQTSKNALRLVITH